MPSPDVSVSRLQLRTWQAGFHGMEADLIDPAIGTSAPAEKMIGDLPALPHPVVTEYGEEAAVKAAVAEIMTAGTVAGRQCEAYAVATA